MLRLARWFVSVMVAITLLAGCAMLQAKQNRDEAVTESRELGTLTCGVVVATCSAEELQLAEGSLRALTLLLAVEEPLSYGNVAQRFDGLLRFEGHEAERAVAMLFMLRLRTYLGTKQVLMPDSIEYAMVEGFAEGCIVPFQLVSYEDTEI